MNLVTLAAILFAALMAISIGFQICLAAGAPWGEFAMGGKFPGRFPPTMRILAILQALILASLGVVVLSRAEILAWPLWSGSIWIVVAISGVSLVLNTITPSVRERKIWAPFALVMFVSSLVVALG